MEKLKQERDFHKFHQNRVQEEKKTIAENIAKLDELQVQYDEKIAELKKKYEMNLKEKTLEKLEKDKLQKRVQMIQDKTKAHEEEVTKQIEDAQQRGQGKTVKSEAFGDDAKLQKTAFPVDDARPNPFLAQEYDEMGTKLNNLRTIKAHEMGVAGFALHLKKQIIATVSDDCTWKIYNMDDGENILSGEGH